MTKTKKKKLSLKQKRFVDLYLQLANATKAAIRAGYSPKTAYSIGSENLTKPEIIEYLQKRRTQIEELLGFNKLTVIQDLHSIKKRAMQAEAVKYYDPKKKEYVQLTELVVRIDEEGNEKLVEEGVYQFDGTNANRAIENIAKMMGYNEPDKIEDVTPLEKKAPSTVIVNKTYVADQKTNLTTAETD